MPRYAARVAAVEQRVDTATVLFTDVVGSTAQRSRLGEEAADELRLVEAEALSIEQWRVWRPMNLAEAITYRAVQQFAGKREQGRLAEVVPAWREYAADHPRDMAAAAVIAYSVATIGDLDEAARRLHDASGAGFHDIADEAGWPLAVSMFFETAFLVRDRDAARMLHDIFVGSDGCIAFTGGITLGPVARLLGRAEYQLGDTDAADRHFGEAIELARSLASPLWIARCQLDWSKTFLERNDPARAAELADAAEAAIGSLVLPVLQQQLVATRERIVRA
jgi:hypothetical protein